MDDLKAQLDRFAKDKQIEFDDHYQQVMSGQWVPPKTKKTCYIYLIKCNEYHKIGIADNVKNRLDSMQTGNPYLLSIEATLLVTEARDLERKLHKAFESKRIKGEWFTALDDGDMLLFARIILDHLRKSTK